MVKALINPIASLSPEANDLNGAHSLQAVCHAVRQSVPERSAALDAFGHIRKARLEFGEVEMEDGICATLSNGVNQ
mgnify:CR=1 FL=1